MTDSQQLVQLRELATCVRSLIEKTQTINASSTDIAALAAQTKILEKAFAQHSSTRLVSIFGERRATTPQTSEEWAMRLPYGPVTGALNPIAPPVRIEYADNTEKLYGFTTLGKTHEGPQNAVNGGTIASIYDHLLAFATMAFAHPGPTAQLNIRYRAKTPLYTELRFEVWVSKLDGRKIQASGCCYADDLLCSEATALFIKFNNSDKNTNNN